MLTVAPADEVLVQEDLYQPPEALRSLAFFIWGQTRALIVRGALERLLALTLLPSLNDGVNIDIFLALSAPSGFACEFVDCVEPLV